MLLETRLIYFPSRRLVDSPANHGLAYEDVIARTSDGLRIHGWAMPPPGAARAWLLYSHGNGDNISVRPGILAPLVARGVGALIYDYRGYGRSEGRPDEEGTYRDGEAMLAEVLRRAGGPRRVFLLGESLGGGVSHELALRHPDLAGLITTSTFTNIPDMVRTLVPVPGLAGLMRTRYDNLGKLPRITMPRLVLHGTDDPLVPFWMAERLRDATRPPADFHAVAGAGHNDIFAVDGPGCYAAIMGFIERCV